MPDAATRVLVIDDNPSHAEVVVEVKKYKQQLGYIQITTKWGTTTLIETDEMKVTRVPLLTVSERFKAKNIDPEGYTLYTYAAMQVWTQAVAKAGTAEPKKVMETIKAGDWDTVLGKLGFDAKGDIKVIDYVVYKWDAKGNYTEINPKGS